MKKILFSFVGIVVFCIIPQELLAKTSNDPYVQQWAYEDLGIYRAWEYAIGADTVVVAVIDNGFDTFHPDLQDNVWRNSDEIENNGIDDDRNGYIDDVYGWNFYDNTNDPRPSLTGVADSEIEEGIFHHGTFVAGIIGARGNNGIDGVGVNWNVKLMNLKVLGNSGSGDLGPLVDAIYYAVDNGADIINISMVGDGTVSSVMDAINYAYAKNVVVVAAAGNNMIDLNQSPLYPVCADATFSQEKIVGVSAMDEEHHMARFSNSGSQCIDITAPGVGIQSTLRFSPTSGLYDSYSVYNTWSGTSFSAPFVSGAAALIKSVQPTWGPDKIYSTLFSTVQHTPSQDESVYANLFGRGLLQVDKAVALAVEQQETVAPINTTNPPISVPTVPVSLPTQRIQDRYNFVGKKMWVISAGSGQFEERNDGQDQVFPRGLPILQGIDDIKRLHISNTETGYAIVRKKTDSVRVISIHTKNWHERATFEIPTSLPVDIAVGDIHTSGGDEILISYVNTNEIIVDAYSTAGTKLLSTSRPSEARYFSIGVASQIGAKRIVVAYPFDDGTRVEILDPQFASVLSFDMKAHIGTIATGDINADSVDELIFGSATGYNPVVYYTSLDGTIQKKFLAHQATYKQGMHIEVFDYNRDGLRDIIISPRGTNIPVIIFDASGNTIESWYALQDATKSNIHIVPLVD